MYECGKCLVLIYAGFMIAWYVCGKVAPKVKQWLEQKADQYGFKGPE